MNEVVLQTVKLTRRFGGLTAVSDVSLELGRGEIHCIIGPNGAGKSTLLNMVCGTIAPTSGRVLFQTHDLVGRSKHAIARLGIARKFQVPSVFQSLTVHENLEVARNGLLYRDEEDQELERTLDLIDLTAKAKVEAGSLSHGQKQWLEIGMALMLRPKLLLLDEPTAGMTVDETIKTARLLLSLKGQLTILAIEHDMRFVRELGSHTTVMHQGCVIAAGAFGDIEANDTVRDVYLGRH